jgi:adenylate/guanylate cyclase family protein
MVDEGAPVTILFTDVEGSTDLRTRRGDAAAHEILREHEGLVRACVAEHGGREVKALGDGFMVVFASVRRALACAIGIQQAVDEEAWKSPGSAVRGVGGRGPLLCLERARRFSLTWGRRFIPAPPPLGVSAARSPLRLQTATIRPGCRAAHGPRRR